MKFRPEKRTHRFNNLAASVVAHATALGGAGLAIYWTLQDHSLLPLGVAFAVLCGLEGLWVYASRRR